MKKILLYGAIIFLAGAIVFAGINMATAKDGKTATNSISSCGCGTDCACGCKGECTQDKQCGCIDGQCGAAIGGQCGCSKTGG